MNLVLVTGHMLPPGPTNALQDGQQSSSHNPLRLFSMIGEWAFNQDKVATFPFDWETLLQSNLGIPAETVKRLVFNRCEMQEDARLDDKAKELVALLKEHYGIAADTESQHWVCETCPMLKHCDTSIIIT